MITLGPCDPGNLRHAFFLGGRADSQDRMDQGTSMKNEGKENVNS